MTDPHPADSWRVPPTFKPITADEASALAIVAQRQREDGGVVVHTADGWAIRLDGDGAAAWATRALAVIRNPPPPEPTPEDVAAEHGLVVGQVYDVVLSDCCAEGRLRLGAYLGPHMVPDRDEDPPTFHSGWRFDAGTIGPTWGALEFKPVDAEEASG